MIVARWALVAALAMLAADGASDINLDVRAVLTRYLRFGSGELADLQRGKVVRHGIDTSAPGEIAVAGAVKVNASKAAFLAGVRDIVRFKRSPDVLQIGRFSNPPAMDDLAGLTVTSDDFNVQTCRAGNCGVRLPAEVISRIQRELEPAAADAPRRAEALFKHVLLDHVTAYVNGAAGRFTQYDDSPRPIRPIDELEGILTNTPSLEALVPGLTAHLRNYPQSRLTEAEDFLYWSKEKVGVAPFITVTHVTIVCRQEHTCIVATKDVYSSRYLDASLSISIASDAVSTANAFYLVYANRSRARALKGMLSGLRKSIVERRARGALEESLRTIKLRLENGEPRAGGTGARGWIGGKANPLEGKAGSGERRVARRAVFSVQPILPLLPFQPTLRVRLVPARGRRGPVERRRAPPIALRRTRA